MARSYKIKPDQLEEVHIYVDTRGKTLRVLHDIDLFRKATGISDPSSLVCFDPSEHPSGLPDGVFKESAQFAPLTYTISEEIDKETIVYDENPANSAEPRVRLDLTKRSALRIKYLLRSWSLSDTDGTLALTTYKRPDGRVHLTNESLQLVNNEVDPKLVKGFLEAYEFARRSEYQQMELEAVEAIKESSGGKLNVKN